MGKVIFVMAGLISALLLVGLSTSQGMGGSKAYDRSGYDWMGTPVSSANQVSTIIPDCLSLQTQLLRGWLSLTTRTRPISFTCNEVCIS
jgi:hypothetical protein